MVDILGISAFYHDSAAALVRDGDVVAAAQEERFSRVKFDSRFPIRAMEYCLRAGGIDACDVDYVVFYEKPFRKFERILLTQLATFPRSWQVFREAMTAWMKEKLWLKSGASPARPREHLTLRAVRSALALHAPEEGPRAPDRRLHERELTKARDDVASWGGQMYFVYLPAWDRYRHPERITSFKDDVLASVEGLGIPTIDMVEAFEAVPDPLDLFPFRSRGHYTEPGYHLVADAILAALAPSDPQPLPPPAS